VTRNILVETYGHLLPFFEEGFNVHKKGRKEKAEKRLFFENGSVVVFTRVAEFCLIVPLILFELITIQALC
jgi:hypothetical protein